MPNTKGLSRGSHPKPFTSRSTPTGRGSSSIVGRGREIANEWSPRGRGNNSSSGNGMDIPDECSPIGRGSNNSGNGRGRAHDCSPRGRGSNNTSGNGRGRADDCSPRGRGSNNTPVNGRNIVDDCSLRGRGSSSIGGHGNESADEWCPSPNILGDERLDVHEDNEEHMEHVVGSSTKSDWFKRHPSSSLLIMACQRVLRHMGQKFPNHRDSVQLFLRTFLSMEMLKEIKIQDAWESSIKEQPMVNVWDTDAWRLKSKTAKENRDKSQSGKHTAGSRSFLHTKIVMEKKKGRKVKLVELHTAVHTKKGTKPGEPGSSEIPEFVDPMSKQRLDEYSKIISEKHNENEENTEIDENGSKSPPDDFEVWKGVGTSNRGHVLGAGFTTDPAFVLTGTMGSGSIYATHTCSPYEEIRILKKQNDDLKKKMEDAEAQRVADQLALQKTLNDFAKNYPPRITESDPGPS
ncbi:transposase, Ptta/En/Spm [Tanacetum coccineum]